MITRRLTRIKPLQGFAFSFHPLLNTNGILALAELLFVEQHEVVHLLGANLHFQLINAR